MKKKLIKKAKSSPSVPLTQVVSAGVVVAGLTKQSQKYLKVLNALPAIKSQDDFNTKALAMSCLKELGKEAIAKEAVVNDLAKKIIKENSALFKPFKDLVAQREMEVKADMLLWIAKTEKAKEKILADVDSGKRVSIGAALKAQDKIGTPSSEHSQTRKVWTLKIKDVTKIPHHLMLPDEMAIKEVFKAGGTVAGCEWVQEKTIAI